VVGGKVTIHRTHIREFTLGPIRLGDDAGVGQAVAVAGAGRFDAVVGYSFLKNSSFTIDYRSGSFEFGPRPASIGLSFTLAPKLPLMVVRAVVNGTVMRLAFDTASSSTLLSNRAAERAGIARGNSTQVTGAGGAEKGTASSAIIAGLGIRPERVRVIISAAVDRVSAEAGTRIDGVVGPAALRLYRVAIDYPRRQIWFKTARASSATSSQTICPRIP
jgi:aspartyl protease